MFGDVIWHATDKLNLTFGLRYTRDEKDFSWFNDVAQRARTLDAVLDALRGGGPVRMRWACPASSSSSTSPSSIRLPRPTRA